MRPCFVPLPPVGYLSLQSLPSQGSLHPSRGRLLPCGHPRAPACAARGLVTAGFADARVIADALAGLPPRLWAPFRPTTHGWEASWSPWTARGGLTPGRTVHPLRSLDPLAKSAPLDPTSFLVGAAVLSWVSSPPEPSPPAPRTLMTRRSLGPRRPARSRAQARPRGPRGPRVRWTRASDRNRSSGPVGGLQPGEGWPAPPRGGVPSPTASDPWQGRPCPRPDPRSFVVSGQRHLLP